ncbi:MAG TPA: hypothetical protein VGA34_08320 [Alteraurantiacibacter sp.]|jgi:hypothetical protein
MEDEQGEGWYRRKIGKRIELGVNKALGWLLALIAFFALFLTFSSTQFSFATHWPGVIVGVGLLVLARLCFRAKTGIIQGFGEETSSSAREWPKRKRD